jgi:hypothetical protein
MRGSQILFSLALTAACSNGSNPSDAGNDATSSDASFDAPVLDAATEASVPATLDQQNKLALWLEASSSNVVLSDGGVATWKDLSKNKNDAAGSGTMPTVLASAVGGHDAVSFLGKVSPLTIADAASLHFGTDQVFIAAVTRAKTLKGTWFQKTVPDDAGSYDGIEFFVANGGPLDGGTGNILSPYAAFNGFPGNSLQWGTPELNDGNFHVVMFRRTSATSLEIAVDDVAPRSQNVSAIDVTAAGAAVIVGIGDAAFPSVDVAIAEELVLHDASGTISDADVASVHAYLKQKYGL